MAVTRDTEAYPGARANLLLRIPKFVSRALIVGEGVGELGRFLRRRGVRELHAIEYCSQKASETRTHFDCVLDPPSMGTSVPFPESYFDAIVITCADTLLPSLAQTVAMLLPSLKPEGYVLALFANPSHYRFAGGPSAARQEVEAALKSAGLVVYAESAIVPPEDSTAEAGADGCLDIGGGRYPIASSRDREALLATDFVQYAVRPDYNPLLHAREVMHNGQPEAAYELLTLIPEPYMQDPHVVAIVSSDIMMALLGIDIQAGPHNRLNRFALSQQFFFRTVGREPHLHIAHQCQAEFWRRIGDMGMARRLLRSLLYVVPDAESEEQLHSYEQSGVPDLVIDERAPIIEFPDRPLRLFYVMHPRSHYGLDILYDGLCQNLGAQNVTDFPWKPWLHGQTPDALGNYPCLFNYPGVSLSMEQAEARLAEGRYDVILFGDLEQSLPRDLARRLIKAGERCPVFLVDQLDEAVDMRRETTEHLGITEVAGYFKREMLACFDYGPNTWPLPFAYAESRIPADVGGARTIDFFWAGHRGSSLRRLYLEHLEARFGWSLDTYVSQEKYAETLLNVRIGINIFGHGFDTVRYWELPAHGCMLLSERLPIRVPENFRDRQSAVFFDDTQSLEEALTYYLAHSDEVETIARAGREHLLKHHTTSVRARQAIARIEQVLASVVC